MQRSAFARVSTITMGGGVGTPVGGFPRYGQIITTAMMIITTLSSSLKRVISRPYVEDRLA
jgi:hypothetical protein